MVKYSVHHFVRVVSACRRQDIQIPCRCVSGFGPIQECGKLTKNKIFFLLQRHPFNLSSSCLAWRQNERKKQRKGKSKTDPNR